MTQSHDSSDDYKFPVTANKDCYFYVVTINACEWRQIPANLTETK